MAAAEAKTKPTNASVIDYLATVEPAVRRSDAEQVIAIMQEVTGHPPVLWGSSLIGFGQYSYTYGTGRTGDWPIVAVAPRKANLVVYVMPGFERYETLLAQLGKHKTGVSCLYLNRLADVNLDVLRTLITDSVAMMREKYPSAT